MAKKYTCDVCSQEMTGDRESELVERAQDHVESEHGSDIEADEIRRNIEDT